MDKFSSKSRAYTVLVSYSVHENFWELWLFVREFPIAAMLNHLGLKVTLCKSLEGLVELQVLATRK